MYNRILIPLDGHTDVEPVLARAEKVARKLGCPIHLVCFIDVSALAHCGAHGPSVDATRYRTQVPAEHATAHRYLKSVAQELMNRGIRVTYEVRPGLLGFELPAAVRPGDLLVTESQQCLELSRSPTDRCKTEQDLIRYAHRPAHCP